MICLFFALFASSLSFAEISGESVAEAIPTHVYTSTKRLGFYRRQRPLVLDQAYDIVVRNHAFFASFDGGYFKMHLGNVITSGFISDEDFVVLERLGRRSLGAYRRGKEHADELNRSGRSESSPCSRHLESPSDSGRWLWEERWRRGS